MRGIRWSMIVAVLCGSLVLSATGPAAAVEYGAATRADWVVGGSWTGDPQKCSANFYYASIDLTDPAHYQVRVADWKCVNGHGSPGAYNDWGSSEARIYFTGTAAGAGSCTYDTGTMVDFGAQDNFEGANETAYSTTAGCEATQACIEGKTAYHGTPDSEWSDCVTVDLGPLPGSAASTSCAYMNFTAPPNVHEAFHTIWNGEEISGVTFPAAVVEGAPASTWVTYLVLSNGQIIGGNQQNQFQQINEATLLAEIMEHESYGGPYIVQAPPGETIVGAGVARYVVVGGTPNVVPALPQNSATGVYGVTDAAECQFYWGEKIAAIEGSDTDEPAGPLGGGGGGEPTPDPVEPEPDDSECGFDLTDPGTYASAGICQLVGLFRDLIRVVGGIAGAILGGIGSVLSGLFVPSSVPSFTDVEIDVPEGWLPTLPSVSDGSCGPITMPDINLGFGKNDRTVEVDSMTLVDTCDAPWPLVRTFTYNGMLAVVLIGVVRAAFRALMNALGMGVEAVSGGDDK